MEEFTLKVGECDYYNPYSKIRCEISPPSSYTNRLLTTLCVRISSRNIDFAE